MFLKQVRLSLTGILQRSVDHSQAVCHTGQCFLNVQSRLKISGTSSPSKVNGEGKKTEEGETPEAHYRQSYSLYEQFCWISDFLSM